MDIIKQRNIVNAILITDKVKIKKIINISKKRHHIKNVKVVQLHI